MFPVFPPDAFTLPNAIVLYPYQALDEAPILQCVGNDDTTF